MHLMALVAMGLPLFDECDLEDLGREAAKRKFFNSQRPRWLFRVERVPLSIPSQRTSKEEIMANSKPSSLVLLATLLLTWSGKGSGRSGRRKILCGSLR
jgi:hypothetical protein